MVLKKIARRELPTTTYMGRPSTTAISGTMKGPPPQRTGKMWCALFQAPYDPGVRQGGGGAAGDREGTSGAAGKGSLVRPACSRARYTWSAP